MMPDPSLHRTCAKTLLLCIVFPVLIAACTSSSKPKRTQAILPPVEVVGAESSSFSLYSKSPGRGTTALGQIFLPPKGHLLLTRVEFLCRHSSIYHGPSDINVKLRISPWTGDRPASAMLWESEPVLVKKDINGWVSFDVPHIRLNPDRRHIAWLFMAGLQNADDASFSVVRMGPRTTSQRRPNEPWQPDSWISSYPEGARAFWRQSNPDGLVDVMTESPWITDGSGQNLHFRMVFENTKPSENAR
jgi:hypothetical protein